MFRHTFSHMLLFSISLLVMPKLECIVDRNNAKDINCCICKYKYPSLLNTVVTFLKFKLCDFKASSFSNSTPHLTTVISTPHLTTVISPPHLTNVINPPHLTTVISPLHLTTVISSPHLTTVLQQHSSADHAAIYDSTGD